MSIYSPTQTQDYSRCPVYWDFKKRWQAPGKQSPNMAIGRTLHRAMEVFWIGDTPPPVADIMAEEWKREFPNEEQVDGLTLDACILKAEKVWKAGTRTRVELSERGKLLRAEMDFGESRVDLVLQHATGLIVVDYKYRDNLKPYYLEREERETAMSHQFLHYAWRVSNHFEWPVTEVVKVLMIAAPKPCWVTFSAEVTPEKIDLWLAGATKKWGLMEQKVIFPREEACELYGGCPFRDACWVLNRDESKMANLFERRDI